MKDEGRISRRSVSACIGIHITHKVENPFTSDMMIMMKNVTKGNKDNDNRSFELRHTDTTDNDDNQVLDHDDDSY